MSWLGGIEAATRLQQARDALGIEAVALIVAHVHRGLMIGAAVRAETGRVGGTAMGRAANAFATVLKALASHYAEADHWGSNGILKPKPVRDTKTEMAA